MANQLRRQINEAVVIKGNEKYMSRSGRFYHYDKDGKRTEITEEDYVGAIRGTVSGGRDSKGSNAPRSIKAYSHNLDIDPEDSYLSEVTKKQVKDHFSKEIAPTLPDDVDIDYKGAGGGYVYISAKRGTTKSPIDVYGGVSYNKDGTLTYEAIVEDPETGRSLEIDEIPIRDLKDLDSILDRSARAIKDKGKDKDRIGLKDFSKQESKLLKSLRERRILER